MRLVAWLSFLCLAGCDRVLGLTRLPPDAAIDAPPDAAVCPTNYTITLSSTPGSHYRIVSSFVPWLNAALDCADDAPGVTHLIVIDVDPERIEIAAQVPNTSLWLGLTDRRVENTFLWVTDGGSPTPPPTMGSEPWAAGQPDDSGQQDCVRIQGTTTLYDDGQCTSNFAFACECDAFSDDPTRY